MHKSVHLMNKNKNKDIFTRLMNFGQAEELKKQRIFRKNHQLKFQTKNCTKRREKTPARENIKLMIPSILSDTVPKRGPRSPRSKTIDVQEKGDLYSLVALYHGVGNSLPKHYKVKPKSNMKFPRISEGSKIQLVSKITNGKRIKSKPKSVNKIYHLKSFEKGSSESIKKRKNIKRMAQRQKSQLSSTVNELFPRYTHQVEDEETANLSNRKLISASLDMTISKSKNKSLYT
ncbi:unnamed protein product [Moneuplotes crassus]|uniref:Uncharacterized protein n=1 Tax=Euplotes crassus TaxID=5936 RepID=A0AAD1Y9H3_EUPCR|nr:unnamed protein product [Moneuplotes crassus]